MINTIIDFITKNNLIQEKDKILLGLSGGPDSVFLLHFLKYYQKYVNFELIAAHLDHEWRKNSYLDVKFCKKLTKNLKIKFISAKWSDLNINLKPTGSKEEFGRKMRRAFFEKIAKENNITKIALAHHLNDQEETFFIRLIRGTTLTGLTCMWPQEGIYIRPLLEIKKNDILDFLDQNKIDYLIDPTNISTEFLRNRIRNKVIPNIQESDKRFDDNFLRTLNQLQNTELFIEKITEENFKQIVTQNNNLLELNLKKYFNLDEFLQYKILILWLKKSKVQFQLTEKFLDEIHRFLKQNKSKSHQIHHDWKIKKEKNMAFILL